jgi:hypothetical protein
MRVVGHAQLIGDGEQQRVGLRDRFVRPELLDEFGRFGGVAAAEYRPRPLVDEPDLVLLLAFVSETGVPIRETAARRWKATLLRLRRRASSHTQSRHAANALWPHVSGISAR